MERKMVCPICGIEIYNEYYEGGYIDHVTNFAGSDWNKSVMLKRGVGNCVFSICFNGNDIRYENDIRERLECFMKWKEPDDNTKEQVKHICERLLKDIENAREKAEKLSKDLTAIEKFYLCEKTKGAHFAMEYIDKI